MKHMQHTCQPTQKSCALVEAALKKTKQVPESEQVQLERPLQRPARRKSSGAVRRQRCLQALEGHLGSCRPG